MAIDGEQALQELRSQPFDLIILDLGLPKVDGWAILQELQRLGNQGPVIVVTAEIDVRDAVLQTGAHDYLAKPFRFQDLLTSIQAALSL
ncbi:putative transcriptional regulatory protein YedW [Acaryochloris thomasi RCC1774]|uniref:Putative transcriptional regulatory protein YedW n=1 Tax=Acaryochloris thomasi RCC1774 TaxID=1764569 RepID=A0A2W1JQI6_9CYAN|nr:putative transcriptional regulatory protein YedW [Acaryochloris thomasi RCC1774]